MRRWLDPKWYGFLWQRNDRRGVAVVVLVLLIALGAGGYAAASSMKSNDTAVGTVKVEAVQHTVRVHGRDRVVTQYVTLATTNVVPPSTIVSTRVVTRPVVRTVRSAPVVRRQLVYVTGKGTTVTRSRTVTQQHTQTQTRTQTQVATETSVQTVTQPTTVLESRTVTRRVTVTSPPETVTVTGAVLTVTLPGKTVTRTTTVTVTSPTTTSK